MYFLATCLALLYRHLELRESVGFRDLPAALVGGSGWGIYYFVPVLLGVLCVSIVPARYPKAAAICLAIFLPALFAVRWKWQFDPMVARWGMFGMFRSPFFWWGYFFSGWVGAPYLRKHRDVSLWAKLLLIAAAISGIGLLYATAGWHFSPVRALLLSAVPFPIMLSIFSLSSRPPRRVTLALSNSSYEIYLLHIFAVDLIMRRFAVRDAGIGFEVELLIIAIGVPIAIIKLLTGYARSVLVGLRAKF